MEVSRRVLGQGAVRALALLVLFGLGARAAAEQPVYRLMPVGDSITEGRGTLLSYRYPLWEKLFAAGYLVEYVGSRTSESRVGPLRHEGYGGKNAEYLAVALAKNSPTHLADIVLIHTGHNHTNTEAPVPGIVAATEAMIRTVTPRPAMVFFLGGGWGRGTPLQFYPECAHFAERGTVAIGAEYRIASACLLGPVRRVSVGTL